MAKSHLAVLITSQGMHIDQCVKHLFRRRQSREGHRRHHFRDRCHGKLGTYAGLPGLCCTRGYFLQQKRVLAAECRLDRV